IPTLSIASAGEGQCMLAVHLRHLSVGVIYHAALMVTLPVEVWIIDTPRIFTLYRHFYAVNRINCIFYDSIIDMHVVLQIKTKYFAHLGLQCRHASCLVIAIF